MRLTDEFAHQRAALQSVGPGPTPDVVHDLRIALRQMRAVLGASDGVLATETIERYRSALGELAGAAAPTRDLDALIEEWRRYSGDPDDPMHVSLLPVLEDVHARRRRAAAELVDVMSSARVGALMAAWTSALGDIEQGRSVVGTHAERRLSKHVRRSIHRAQRRLIRDGRAVGDKTAATDLHELRKDAKKLRYLVDSFGEVLPQKSTRRFIRRLKSLQDNLGRIQDGEVHRLLIAEIAGDLAQQRPLTASDRSLQHLLQRIDETQRRARDDFAETFARFDRKSTRRLVADITSG